ncbi:MAG: family 20 glycosylhydrolase [Bacteroidia bacterium]|nr:family 20 glycosylhydrolase [Bacteroidia bacterium]
MKSAFALLLVAFCCSTVQSQDQFPVRGFAIGAPRPADVDLFVKFIHNGLATQGINTLILRVDYNYQYTTRPELRDSIALSRADVKKIVAACKQHGIRIVPQINLLGHQSLGLHINQLTWRVLSTVRRDTTCKMPEKYAWPNEDGLYCKSYCPLHPEVHAVVFQLVDELCDAFEADAFHAGMDEVFYLGDEKCPRCAGRDKAELFAGEVRTIRDHLALKGRELWIWGDRLIDGKITGLGEWEASYNNTHRAVDMIPKDVVICDWHYERADKTAYYFAMKGLRVATCPWRNPGVTQQQTRDMAAFRKDATPEMKDRFIGMIQTVWSDAKSFIEGYNANKKDDNANTAWASFRVMTTEMKAIGGY